MQNKRRELLKVAGLAGLAYAAYPIRLHGGSAGGIHPIAQNINPTFMNDVSIIGPYGTWASSLNDQKIPALSYRGKTWKNLSAWRKQAQATVIERMAIPDLGKPPAVSVVKTSSYDGLTIEELNWQLPYGRATRAIVLKPAGATGRLPGILAFHDHGGNKYFGCEKVTRSSNEQHPLMRAHQEEYYTGRAWANEMARRGYVVMVSDAFTFASRRVMLADVPEDLRNGLHDETPATPEHISAYNTWAGQHEHIMAKSLFSAGTTWPGVFFGEDRVALDIFAARPDVDASRIGCGGLSGGGLRTVFMGGLDPRIKCAVDVGFMTTWKDFILHKSYTHTWMSYVPLLPNELDFPEILGLRVPLPTLVQNDREDDLYTMPEMRRAEVMLAEIYQKAGSPERFRCSFYDGKHKFDAEMQGEAFDWFDRWLKG